MVLIKRFVVGELEDGVEPGSDVVDGGEGFGVRGDVVGDGEDEAAGADGFGEAAAVGDEGGFR